MVFPEATLYIGAVETSADFYVFATKVPEGTERIAPCDSKERHHSDALKRLSCAARRSGVYLVVNVAEKTVCSENPVCKVGKWNLYNTNVAFDRDGVVIARYGHQQL